MESPIGKNALRLMEVSEEDERAPLLRFVASSSSPDQSSIQATATRTGFLWMTVAFSLCMASVITVLHYASSEFGSLLGGYSTSVPD